MLLDLQTTFSGAVAADGTKTGQAITATAISTNVLDLRPSGSPALAQEALTGSDLWLVVQAQTAAAGGDAAKTLTITLESDVAASLASAPVVHFTSAPITGATLVAGYVAVQTRLPALPNLYKRYLGVRYTVSAAFTAFGILAFLTLDAPMVVNYPSGFSIDV